MENREQQILSEIKSMMASIRSQLELLDAKMAELQQVVDPEDFDSTPIDLDIDMTEPVIEDLPEAELTFEPEVATENDTEDLPEPGYESIAETEPAQEPEPKTEATTETVEEIEEPELVLETESILEMETDDEPAKATDIQPATAVIDTMTAKHPWKTDMPGTAVKDIRSAISLNDRIIFINYLYDEDPMAFQNSLTKINTMSSLDEVLEYIAQEHPDWNLESEVVYRFMMAVRRRIR